MQNAAFKIAVYAADVNKLIPVFSQLSAGITDQKRAFNRYSAFQAFKLGPLKA
jgi:hypothetical protein